jgi:hypothetical protein
MAGITRRQKRAANRLERVRGWRKEAREIGRAWRAHRKFLREEIGNQGEDTRGNRETHLTGNKSDHEHGKS